MFRQLGSWQERFAAAVGGEAVHGEMAVDLHAGQSCRVSGGAGADSQRVDRAAGKGWQRDLHVHP
jgi:hypothetical protein